MNKIRGNLIHNTTIVNGHSEPSAISANKFASTIDVHKGHSFDENVVSLRSAVFVLQVTVC